jgi:hypothetical protein
LRLWALVALIGRADVAGAQAEWFLSTQDADTLSIERFERSGDNITGVWVTYTSGAEHRREILRHEYTISLRSDGRPRHVHLTLRRPDGSVQRTFDVRLSDDSVVITANPDSLPPHRLAASRAYPILGLSMSMYELVIAGARARGRPRDSTSVMIVPITGPFTVQTVPIFLIGPDSARIGAATGATGATIFTDGRARIDSIVTNNGSVPIKRVPPFDLDVIAAGAALVPTKKP